MPREVKKINGSDGNNNSTSPEMKVQSEEVLPFRAGYVAIIGEPNVGKSTLINLFVGQNISAVTRKPQTTRQKILGLLSTDQFQAVFVDTPGIFEPCYLLHEVMVRSAVNALNNADVIILVVDSAEDHQSYINIVIGKLKNIRKPVYLALNKIDLISDGKIEKLVKYYAGIYHFRKIFPISALNGSRTSELLKSVINDLPVHPPLYPPDIVSDFPEKFFVGEIIREKIFEKYKEEIPYSTAVEIIEFSEREGRKDVIRAEIIVERESQKAILIGKGGKAMKEIGKKARTDIESFLGREVFLELFVKVKANWRNDQQLLKRFGYLL
jgi:GTP-binding protein Era